MPDRVTRHGAGAVFDVTPDGVLVVRWQGVVTLRAADAVKEAVCARLLARPAGVVSDYRRAAVAMSDAELAHIMMGGQHDLADLPAAVVANDSMWDSLFGAGLKAAWAGRWRRVCHDEAQALAWARVRCQQGLSAQGAALSPP